MSATFRIISWALVSVLWPKEFESAIPPKAFPFYHFFPFFQCVRYYTVFSSIYYRVFSSMPRYYIILYLPNVVILSGVSPVVHSHFVTHFARRLRLKTCLLCLYVCSLTTRLCLVYLSNSCFAKYSVVLNIRLYCKLSKIIIVRSIPDMCTIVNQINSHSGNEFGKNIGKAILALNRT